jgi:hypothetical protein
MLPPTLVPQFRWVCGQYSRASPCWGLPHFFSGVDWESATPTKAAFRLRFVLIILRGGLLTEAPSQVLSVVEATAKQENPWTS